MHWTFDQLAIAFGGAFIAGIINALAGNGSVITLTLLTEWLGFQGNIANGTNRVGVLMNSLGAFAGFRKNTSIKPFAHWEFILPVIVGAIIGTFVATQVTHAQFMGVFKGLMVLMLVVVLVRPERWLIEKAQKSQLPKVLVWPVMLTLGFYGGFIQMGMGVFYLAVLVLVARLPMLEANAIKAISVGSFTLLAVVIFSITGQVVWFIGLVMGGAQFLGGWLSAHIAGRISWASKFAYGILVIAVSLSVLKLFDVF